MKEDILTVDVVFGSNGLTWLMIISVRFRETSHVRWIDRLSSKVRVATAKMQLRIIDHQVTKRILDFSAKRIPVRCPRRTDKALTGPLGELDVVGSRIIA